MKKLKDEAHVGYILEWEGRSHIDMMWKLETRGDLIWRACGWVKIVFTARQRGGHVHDVSLTDHSSFRLDIIIIDVYDIIFSTIDFHRRRPSTGFLYVDHLGEIIRVRGLDRKATLLHIPSHSTL